MGEDKTYVMSEGCPTGATLLREMGAIPARFFAEVRGKLSAFPPADAAESACRGQTFSICALFSLPGRGPTP